MWSVPEPRVGLGCMRLREESAGEVIAAALEEGITVFDTARAYEGNEALLARHLRDPRARVVTKGGMKRDGARFVPDGRARSLREDCEASLRALGGLPIDLYLVHAPDPKVAWSTTVRALAGLTKLVRFVGVSNVTRAELDEALELAPIACVEVELETAIRSGVLARCVERGIPVLAHSPLGGPKRAKSAPRALTEIAARHGASAQEIQLAGMIAASPLIVPIPGASRVATVRSIARASRLTVREPIVKLRPARVEETGAEVVLLMGLQGAGKSTLAARFEGHARLSRDLLGGTMKGLHAELARRLRAGEKKLVLDNTYLTRAHRFGAIEAAHENGAGARGVFLDVALETAQVHVIRRMLAAHGRLLEPGEMERGKDPTMLPPHALFRAARALERPSLDEGFSALDFVPATRARSGDRAARYVAIGVKEEGIPFGWLPGRSDDHDKNQALRRSAGGLVRVGQTTALVCTHAAGPPRCWCRPPLPGLILAHALAHGIDLEQSVIVGTSPAHAAMAAALGCAYVVSSAR